jgi:hypothetical protein
MPQPIETCSDLEDSIEKRRTELRLKEQDRALKAYLTAAGRCFVAEEAFDDGFSDEPIAWYWIAAWFVGFGTLIAFAWIGG